MLRYLKLQNFRRHVDTELTFAEDEQLIVVSGPNGAGKSTVVEGLFFALFGETRNGRKGLSNLVRRGAEIEGLTVVAEFDVADTLYRVERRRVGTVSSAVLWADGTAIAETPNHVSAELAGILGMDSVGFRTAVLARQKELEGLNSMDASERKRVLTKLLRIDQVGKATTDAQKSYRAAVVALEALGPAPDMEALEQDVTEATQVAGQADETLARVVADVEGLKAELELTRGVEAEWRSAQEKSARASGRLDAAKAALGAKREELGNVEPFDVPQYTGRSAAEIAEALTTASKDLAVAEAAAEAAETRSMLGAEVEGLETAIARLTAEAASLEERQATGSTTSVDEAEATAAACTAAHEEALVGLAEIRTERRNVERDLSRAHELDNVCDACGQDVTEEHRAETLDKLNTAATRLAREEESQTNQVADLNSARDRSSSVLQQCRAEAATAMSAATRLLVVHEELENTERRRKLFTKRMAVATSEPQDATEIRERLAALEKEKLVCAEAQKLVEQAAAAKATAQRLTQELEDSERSVADAEVLVADTAPGESLVAAWKARQEKSMSLRDIERRQGQHMANQARAKTRLDAAKVRVADANRTLERHTKYGNEARIAAGAKSVLRELHARLSASLRPELEGAIADILSRLSESRFEQVSLSENFEVRVFDDGDWRSLTELSGGEQDLVALATRLALAQVVTNRSGTDAFGLLVLDECVGSQDTARREAILELLREMRGVYKQIILLSHVVGIENAADRVVEIDMVDGAALV